MKSRMPGRGRGGRAHFETVAEEPARVGRRAERVAARVILLLCVRGPMVPHPVVPESRSRLLDPRTLQEGRTELQGNKLPLGSG